MNWLKKKIYRLYVKLYELVSSDPIALAKVKYKFKNGRSLNLDDPKEFAEKLQWLKFYHYTEDYGKYADKYEVRKFVEETVGAQYLNELLGVYESVEDIDWNEMPEKFVMKCTHGSGYNLIVKDKSKLNVNSAKRKLQGFLNSDYFKLNGEALYKNVTPRIVAEKFLDELAHDSILDYKFYCIHGQPVCIWLKTFHDGKYRSCYYDLNWEKIKGDSNTSSYLEMDIPKPSNFDEMVELATKLCQGFIFIRIDLYSIKDKIYFGEMTFFPWGGKKRLSIERFNRELGDMMVLPENKTASNGK